MHYYNQGVNDSFTPLFIYRLSQRFTHRRAGICFRHGIEVAIDIRRGAHIAMSEPFLDLLHRHALCEEHRGAGVAQVVEADFLQVMLLQQLFEVSGDEVGIVELFVSLFSQSREYHKENEMSG